MTPRNDIKHFKRAHNEDLITVCNDIYVQRAVAAPACFNKQGLEWRAVGDGWRVVVMMVVDDEVDVFVGVNSFAIFDIISFFTFLLRPKQVFIIYIRHVC